MVVEVIYGWQRGAAQRRYGHLSGTRSWGSYQPGLKCRFAERSGHRPFTGTITTMGFQTPTYVPIYATMVIHGLTGYTSAVLTAIQSAIVSYLNSLQIGETVTFSSLYSVAQSVMPSSHQSAILDHIPIHWDNLVSIGNGEHHA